MNFRNLRGRVGKLFVSGAIATMPFSMTSCDEATTQAVFDILEALLDCMGYMPENEDITDETTDDVDNDESGLPSSVDWTKYSCCRKSGILWYMCCLGYRLWLENNTQQHRS